MIKLSLDWVLYRGIRDAERGVDELHKEHAQSRYQQSEALHILTETLLATESPIEKSGKFG